MTVPDLQTLTLQDFLPLLHQQFTIRLQSGEAYELELVEARSAGQPAQPGWRQPFALRFTHPRADAYLPQRLYALENVDLGVLEVFLVPMGPEAGHMGYEAIFS